MSGKFQPLVPYLVAVGLVAITLQVTLLARQYLGAMPDASFVAAVAVAAWYGGVWPALIASVISALAVDYYLTPPLYELNWDADHLFRFATFIVVSLIITSLNQSLKRESRRAERREQEARRELEERQRVESERVALLGREREARHQAEAAQRRLAFLADAGRLITASLDFDATLESIGRLIVPTISDWCFVYLLQPGGVVRRAAVTGLPDGEGLRQKFAGHPRSSRFGATPLVGRVLHGERVLVAEVTDDVLRAMAEDEEHARLLAALRATSLMLVPLQIHRRVLGAMMFVSASSGRRFSAEDLALAEELAGRAAGALSNAELYEEAQEANRMKDEFLATVSHELRTPLHAILGWSRLLRSATLDEKAANRALETIERNAQAQAQLVADILDVSRIVTGKLRLDIRPVRLATVIESALDAVRPAAHAKGIEIEAHVGEPTLTVLGDAGRLQQVVWNLLSNAIKFTGSGGRVAVELRRLGDEAEIVVADSGVGIDPDFLPYVFDRFRQADSSTSRSYGGLGLGLAIVRHLAELHGGRVTAGSEGRGAGATFVVRLPAMPAARPAVLRAVSPGAHISRSALAGLRVVAVDDQPDALDLVAASLERYGATVAKAASTHDALDLIDGERPHVLIADIGMPGDDGYALIRELRGRPEQRGSRIPAVALTAYARAEDRDRALDAGYQVHLAKPIDDVELVQTVASLVGRTVT